MSRAELHTIARSLVEGGRGILAADESTGTIGKRLEKIGVNNSEENRRAYRELLFTAPGLGESISGVICYDETLRQRALDGRSFVEVMQQNRMVPGIKVDTGAKALAGSAQEKVTEGLDGLRERLQEYHALGARFAKWRAVIEIAADLPTDYCLSVNAHALARYAALCQENGLVPIVEPEVLMDGDHTIERCYAVTSRSLQFVFAELYAQRVDLSGMLLKPNMVISASACRTQAGAEDVARLSLQCLRTHVPSIVPGIVFLSGGQSDERATEHLSLMNRLAPAAPWKLSFSYGRALQAAALKAWQGKSDQIAAAQSALLRRARFNAMAARGQYEPALEAA
ncbi:MAG: fructose-bisphosphate aldolase class I [Spirochaetales bacterium]|nr:fructose-bisphosphate aldolase class I [Spirochaetales bacterium]